jgi:chemotaxis regulatin CheY-phosphate phosphatase CheZ
MMARQLEVILAMGRQDMTRGQVADAMDLVQDIEDDMTVTLYKEQTTMTGGVHKGNCK